MRTRINNLNMPVACIAVVAYGALLCSTTNPANAAAVLPGSLVSYWNFDEAASGTIAAQDVANDNSLGTVDDDTSAFSGAVTRTAGLIGTGAAFYADGTAAAGVSISDSADFTFTTGITVEVLFNTSTLDSANQEVFRKEDGGNRILLSFQQGTSITATSNELDTTDTNVPGISLGLNIGGAYSELDVEFDGMNGRPTYASINDGTTHHLVGTYDSTTALKLLYLDGVLIGQDTFTPADPILTTGTATGFIGSTGGSGEVFDGIIDELALYNSALSQSEILLHLENVQDGRDYFTNAVPEPSSFLLLALGVLGLTRHTRRRRRRA